MPTFVPGTLIVPTDPAGSGETKDNDNEHD